MSSIAVEAAEACIAAKQLADVATVSAQPGNPLGAHVGTFGGCVAMQVTALAHLAPYNKARSYGIGGPDHLGAVEAFYEEAGLPSRIEISEADTDAAQTLAVRGYVHRSSGLTLARPLDVDDDDVSGEPNAIHELTDTDADDVYLDVVMGGYGIDPSSPLAVMTTAEHRTPELRRFLAIADGRPVAAGALFIHDATGYLAGAATLPAHRHLGYQTALIRRRLDAARRGACDHAVVTVAPGSPSHDNLQRLGFTTLQVRTLWELPLPH
jgi:GNAT superfamily N-acetyltransferase